MRSRLLRGALATALVVASASASSAAPHPTAARVYHCPLIARAQDLEPLGANSMPSINDYGEVALVAGHGAEAARPRWRSWPSQCSHSSSDTSRV